MDAVSWLFVILYIIFFSCSAVEQPDVVFSVEQIRCGPAKTHTPELVPEECGTSDIDGCKPDGDLLANGAQTEDAASNSSSSAELFLSLKEKPEELLQLAPQAGDVIVPLTGETDRRHFSSHETPVKASGKAILC